MTRAKLKVISITNYGESEKVDLAAVYDSFDKKEDNSYSKYTPSANCSLTVTNPHLLGKFTPGQKYYIDFTLAEN